MLNEGDLHARDHGPWERCCDGRGLYADRRSAAGCRRSCLRPSLARRLGGQPISFDRLGVRFVHGDVRCQSDVDGLPGALYGLSAPPLSRVRSQAKELDRRSVGGKKVELNLHRTADLLEHAAHHYVGMVMLSTSRGSADEKLAAIPLQTGQNAFELESRGVVPARVSESIAEAYATTAAVSLYKATKVAPEVLTTEYAQLLSVSIIANRCGMLPGPQGSLAGPASELSLGKSVLGRIGSRCGRSAA